MSDTPQAYGFESGLWQTSTLRKMILDRLKTDIKPRTLRATLNRMNLLCRMPREMPHKFADPETCKKFVKDTEEDGCPAKAGYVNFYEDKMTILRTARAARERLPARRARDDKDRLWKAGVVLRSGQGNTALGAGQIRGVQGFPKDLRRTYDRVAFAAGNSAFHRSQFI